MRHAMANSENETPLEIQLAVMPTGVRERPDHIEENVGSRRVAQHAKQKLLGAREQGATASCGKPDKNNHA